MRGTGWKRLWQEGNTPWDLKGPTPILQWFLQQPSSHLLNLKPAEQILVPGCGSGWDLSVLKARFPQSTIVGMDISVEAIELAKRNCPDCTLRADDFFKNQNPPKNSQIGLAYDHTFFCAIKPALRKDWGDRMSGLLRKDGYLLVVVYPQTNADLEFGPPYLVKLADYQLVLPDFRLLFQSPLPKDLPNHPKRNGENELIALFQKSN